MKKPAAKRTKALAIRGTGEKPVPKEKPSVLPSVRAVKPETFVGARVWKYRAFILDEEAIRRLFKVVDEFSEEPTEIRLYASDGIDRYYDAIDDLVAYHNDQKAQIWEIEFKCGDSAWLMLKANPKGPERAVDGEFKAAETKARSAVDKIGIELRGARPWFHSLAFLAARAPWWILFPILLVGLQFLSKHPEWLSRKASPLSTLVASILGLVLGAAFAAFLRVQAWTFPVATFKIGHGRARFDHQHMVRGVFVVGIAGSTAFAVLRWLVTGQ